MKHIACAALLLALLSSGATPAHAKMQATASLSHVSITVTDLRPDDDQKARYIVMNGAFTEGDIVLQGVEGHAYNEPFLANITLGMSNGSSFADADGTSDSVLTALNIFDPSANLSAAYQSAELLMLAPHTAVTLSARYDQSFSALACDGVHTSCSGTSLIQVFLNGKETRFELDASSQAQAQSGLISLTLTNNSGQWIPGYGFDISTSVAYHSVAIPEPATAALWVCGLLAVGGVARRRATGRTPTA